MLKNDEEMAEKAANENRRNSFRGVKDNAIPTAMWMTALLVTSQSFMYGYVFSCLNACLVTGDSNDGDACFHHTDSSCPQGTIYRDLNLTTVEAQLSTSLMIVGAWISSIFGGKPVEIYGRRVGILIGNSFFVVGSALTGSGNLYGLLIGRFISGIGIGFGSIVTPILLSELAYEETRGIITTMHQVMITLSILVATVAAYPIVNFINHGWQYIQLFPAVLGMLVFALNKQIPESPKWLLANANKIRSRSIGGGGGGDGVHKTEYGAKAMSSTTASLLAHGDASSYITSASSGVGEGTAVERRRGSLRGAGGNSADDLEFSASSTHGEDAPALRVSSGGGAGPAMSTSIAALVTLTGAHKLAYDVIVPLRPKGHDTKAEILQMMDDIRSEMQDLNHAEAAVAAAAQQQGSEGHPVKSPMILDDDDVKPGGSSDPRSRSSSAAGSTTSREITWAEMFRNASRPLFVGSGMMFFQAITGMNTVVFYSTIIFGLAGFSDSILGTSCFGVVNFLATLVAVHLIDKSGRKVLLFSGLSLMCGSLVVLACVLLSTGIAEKTQGMVAVIAVLSFVTGFAVGPGAVMWVVMCEIVPTNIRSKAMGLFLSVNFGTNLVIGQLTLTAIDDLGGIHSEMTDDEENDAKKIGVGYMYAIFAGFCFCALMFMRAYVPETKGKSPEQLHAKMSAPILPRKLPCLPKMNCE